MMQIRTPIIPIHTKEVAVEVKPEIDFQAICVFVAIGFFLDTDTYWTHKKILRSATEYNLSENQILINSKPYFKWHYTPRAISFETALDEFTELFETIIKEQTQGKKVILPLSGGLDSRTQAVALKHLNANVSAYSYEFENGYPETKIAKQIAESCSFEYRSYNINKGYLWDCLDELVSINHCYSDFTSPRQMAILDEFKSMDDVFSLGHWGDVLFDSYDLPHLSEKAQVEFLAKKLVKRGGLQLASKLWKVWSLEGDFEAYFMQRISDLLNTIHIENTNAKLRAFKSKYWAPRWTSVNLAVFSKCKPIKLPYYDNRMCEWICTIPEAYLKNRQLQIAYIKKRNPNVAKLTWQDQRPFNLYNYKKNRLPFNFTYKLVNKVKHELKAILGRPCIQRNWELQFLGHDNRLNLEAELLNISSKLDVPKTIIKEYLEAFYNKDSLQNAHAINMLLVLTKFNQKNQDV